LLQSLQSNNDQDSSDVDSDDESVGSVMSSSSEEIGDETYKAEDTSFADVVEQLTEKRGSLRVSALKSLNESLTSQIMDEQVASRAKTIELYLTRIIRQGVGDKFNMHVASYLLSFSLWAQTLKKLGNLLYQSCQRSLKTLLNLQVHVELVFKPWGLSTLS